MFKLSEKLLELFKNKLELCPAMPSNASELVGRQYTFDCGKTCSASCEDSCNGGCDKGYKWL